MQKNQSDTRMYDPVWSIVNNDEGYYEGDLWHYYWQSFFDPNSKNPFHNFHHHEQGLLNVYEGLLYQEYSQQHGKKHTRSVLAAMVRHDSGHPGKKENDYVVVQRTIERVQQGLAPEDAVFWPDIHSYLLGTVSPHLEGFPPADAPAYLTEGIALVRDADLIQTFMREWKQQVLFGLSAEIGITPYQMLLEQAAFLRGINFQSRWGQEKYGPIRQERLSDLEIAIAQLKKFLPVNS